MSSFFGGSKTVEWRSETRGQCRKEVYTEHVPQLNLCPVLMDGVCPACRGLFAIIRKHENLIELRLVKL